MLMYDGLWILFISFSLFSCFIAYQPVVQSYPHYEIILSH